MPKIVRHRSDPPWPTDKRYDVEMIRDFLDHLACNLRAWLKGLRNEAATLETLVPLMQYSFIYGAMLLPELTGKIDARRRRKLEATWSKGLEHLASLRNLFDEALAAAEHPISPQFEDVNELHAKLGEFLKEHPLLKISKPRKSKPK